MACRQAEEELKKQEYIGMIATSRSGVLICLEKGDIEAQMRNNHVGNQWQTKR